MKQDTQKLPADSQFGKDDVEVISRQTGYQGFFSIQKLELRHKLFEGAWSEPIRRELFVRGGATCMLPYDPVRDQVVLCEQFRIGALYEGSSPWLMELVAGINEEGETPESVACREAQEEAGLEVKALRKIRHYLPSPGGSSESIDLFCGLVNAEGVEGLYGLPHEGEDIRVHVVSREQAYAWVESGRIKDAAGIIALQWLQLNREQLLAEWREFL
ncbi:ADP-ribose diphosphatase [Hahella sp. CR1]|uniref:ADP-ribose diphosphatase n=1 Tax=Hahella sp. CR1 TaxID=2992807 RepID=UPI002442750D|nr:ADP-ribose diphosphatase [Hahella sp. CR1]MDG9670329.1 ADP-ribose diphosphatase [Hahella sp. CR1]